MQIQFRAENLALTLTHQFEGTLAEVTEKSGRALLLGIAEAFYKPSRASCNCTSPMTLTLYSNNPGKVGHVGVSLF